MMSGRVGHFNPGELSNKGGQKRRPIWLEIFEGIRIRVPSMGQHAFEGGKDEKKISWAFPRDSRLRNFGFRFCLISHPEGGFPGAFGGTKRNEACRPL
jgi:hypothetical protein